ncbi:unnamed protein product [Acanthoscelides obtectus]|uniref:Uncharacterized protein n=1 Tax=Acanthoscelides obtectus TaxID=200917 RepID=A0A9P0LEF2_ACAOB|nr:unnamed protein product [Acanthoscelides obtectus]CAK1640645.1 hypothetical protein AOBTE_LOCUS11841 [Acanthoscelides obtectus]
MNAPTPDKRGQHKNRPHKIKEDVIACIMDHIQKFPSEESHYSRNKNCHKKYLSPILNMATMYKLYIEDCENRKLDDSFKVTLSSYAKIFCTKFNLSLATLEVTRVVFVIQGKTQICIQKTLKLHLNHRDVIEKDHQWKKIPAI